MTKVLLCTEDPRLRASLPEADVAREAVEALESAQHDVVVLDASTEYPVRESLRSIHGARRREMFIVLVSDRVTTGDGEQAWRESVDAVVQTDDTEQLAELLRDGRDAKHRLYQRFHGMALERGDG